MVSICKFENFSESNISLATLYSLASFFGVSTNGGNGGGTGLFFIVKVDFVHVDDLLYNNVEFDAIDDSAEVAEVLLFEHGLSFTDE